MKPKADALIDNFCSIAVVVVIISVIAASAVTMILVDQGSASNR